MVVGAKVCELTEDLLWFVCGLLVGILTSPLSLRSAPPTLYVYEAAVVDGGRPSADEARWHGGHKANLNGHLALYDGDRTRVLCHLENNKGLI